MRTPDVTLTIRIALMISSRRELPRYIPLAGHIRVDQALVGSENGRRRERPREDPARRIREHNRHPLLRLCIGRLVAEATVGVPFEPLVIKTGVGEGRRGEQKGDERAAS
jgi:hypothetical protein